MKYMEVGRREGVGWVLGVGGKPKVGNTIVSSNLTSQAAVLVPISGPIDPVVDCRGFQRPSVKADLAIYSLIVGMYTCVDSG